MLTEVPFLPGVVKDETPYGAKGYATESNLIRWVRGKPEPIGGWQQLASGIAGNVRAMHEWTLADGRPYCAIATTAGLFVWDGVTVANITPADRSDTFGNNPVTTFTGTNIVSVNIAAHGLRPRDRVFIAGLTAVNGAQVGGPTATGILNPLSTREGSAIIRVNHANHGYVDNDIVSFPSIAAPISGIDDTVFNAKHRIRVLTTDTYQFEVNTPATATTAGAGGSNTIICFREHEVHSIGSSSEFRVRTAAVPSGTGAGGGSAGQLEIDIAGAQNSTVGSTGGFGSGAFGAGPFGKSVTGVVDTTPRVIGQWSLDNFGNVLVACLSNGITVDGDTVSMFSWPPTGDTRYRAEPIANAPEQVLSIAVTAERYLLACGCTNGAGDFDPMLVRNCDTEDFTVWTPTATNSAGDVRLGTGSRIVGTVKRESGPLIYTDSAVYGLGFVGALDQIYEASQLGVDCGLLSLNAAVQRDNDVYWISPSYQFWSYRGGRPQSIECPLREWFENERLNKAQADKIYGYADTRYEAVSWTFPGRESTEADEYIRVDIPETRRDPMAGWSVGTLNRGAYVNGLRFPAKKPLAVSSDGVLYEHERGWSDNGAARAVFVDWAPFDVKDGQARVSVSRVIVDMENEEAVTLLLTAREYPRGPARSRELIVRPDTQRNDVRISGRQIGMRVTFPGTSYARLSSVRADVAERSTR